MALFILIINYSTLLCKKKITKHEWALRRLRVPWMNRVP